MTKSPSLDLAKAVDPFLADLNSLFKAIWSKRPFVVAPEDNGEISVYTPELFDLIKDHQGDRISGRFSFTLTFDGSKLSTHRSSFKFFTTDERESLFDYEFNRDHVTDPRSYLVIHARRESEVNELSNQRIRDVEAMKFPLGGDMFRPCLEDIILGLDNNFNTGITRDDRELLKERVGAFRREQSEIAMSKL